MTKDRILQKEEFIQQYVLAWVSSSKDESTANADNIVKAAVRAWDLVKKFSEED